MRYLAFAPDVARALEGSGLDFVITGATGWLGQATAEMLAAALGAQFGERVALYGSHPRQLVLSGGEAIMVNGLREIANRRPARPVIFFHFAFLAKDKVAGCPNGEYAARNHEIADLVLEGLQRAEVAGMLLASSGAVYDHLTGRRRDPDANLYGRLKLEDEERFSEACGARGARLVVPRIFNLSGPFINKLDAYALSSIIVDVLHGDPVRIRADRPVWRSYFFVGDLIELCLRWLLGQTSEGRLRFDTVGDEVVEVGDLARRVCRVLGVKGLAVNRPQMIAEAENRYVGDSDALERALADFHYRPQDLNSQIVMTARYISDGLMDSRVRQQA